MLSNLWLSSGCRTCSGWPATKSKIHSPAFSPEASIARGEVWLNTAAVARNRAVETKRGQKNARMWRKLGAIQRREMRMIEKANANEMWNFNLRSFCVISMVELGLGRGNDNGTLVGLRGLLETECTESLWFYLSMQRFSALNVFKKTNSLFYAFSFPAKKFVSQDTPLFYA